MLKVLKVYTVGMVLRKEMHKEEDCWSSVMEKSCAWQTLGYIRQTKEKLLTSVGGCETIDFVLMGKMQKVCKGCESDSMGTSAQAGDHRSEKQGSKNCEKATDHKKKSWKLNKNRQEKDFKNSKRIRRTDAPDL